MIMVLFTKRYTIVKAPQLNTFKVIFQFSSQEMEFLRMCFILRFLQFLYFVPIQENIC